MAGAVAQGAGVHCFFRKGSLGAEVCECGDNCSEEGRGPGGPAGRHASGSGCAYFSVGEEFLPELILRKIYK